MNTLLNKASILLLAILVTACNDTKKQDPTANTATIDAVVTDYLNLKTALVNDDSKTARNHAEQLAKRISSMDVTGYDDEKSETLAEDLETIFLQAKIISTADIATQRMEFKALSHSVSELIDMTGSTKTLYTQFCPMYDGGTAWLSDSKEIRNPYYGSEMLTCGYVKD